MDRVPDGPPPAALQPRVMQSTAEKPSDRARDAGTYQADVAPSYDSEIPSKPDRDEKRPAADREDGHSTGSTRTRNCAVANGPDSVEYPQFPEVPVISPEAPHAEARPRCHRHPDRRSGLRPALLCDKCSVSMMGYVAMLQEFLDTVAEDIADKGAGRRCLWCIKERFHDVLHTDFARQVAAAPGHKQPSSVRKSKSSDGDRHSVPSDVAPHKQAAHPVPSDCPLPSGQPPNPCDVRQPTGSATVGREAGTAVRPAVQEHRTDAGQPPAANEVSREPPAPTDAPPQPPVASDERRQSDSGAAGDERPAGKANAVGVQQGAEGAPQLSKQPYAAPDGDSRAQVPPEHGQFASPETAVSGSWLESPPPPVDGNPLPFPAVDRSSEPLARAASWDRLHGLIQPWITEPLDPETENEAYVTMATDNVQALGCMVLGNSLRLSGTNRTLVVLVTDIVNSALRHLLGSVFHLVQPVRALDPQGTTKLALLEQPELGISFWKLHAWRLTSFTKCVFLDADTLVVQNCDELFGRSELSAVPDIGWPDYFNSGVFVYVPSLTTFWNLVEFADSPAFSDGGEQGLLNLYFRSWVTDVNNRLPFIYNLMANVSYTYTPAFRKFGRDVKIAHFFGSYKPWHVLFHYATGQMSPSANVHPTYAQFVHFWMDIFQKRVLPLFTEDIHRYCRKNAYISAQELMNFFPAPPTSNGMESLPTQPSFRVHLPSVRAPLQDTDPDRYTPRREDFLRPDAESESDVEEGTESPGGETEATEAEAALVEDDEKTPADDAVPQPEDAAETPVDPAADNYHKMMAWEQGRMDYLGRDSSDNIIKRLQTLIKGSQKIV